MSEKETNEINITYETLYELLRREKGREGLQELSRTFFADLIEYLNSKRQIIDNKSSGGMVTADHIKKTEMQYDNIKKILKELYEKRERKIINMALTKIRSGVDIVDTGRLLSEEKMYYDEMLLVFKRFKSGILTNLIDGKIPNLSRSQIDANSEQMGSDKIGPIESSANSNDKADVTHSRESFLAKNLKDNSASNSATNTTSNSATNTTSNSATNTQAPGSFSNVGAKSNNDPVNGANSESQSGKNQKSSVLVRFLQPVPKFLGRELETYGPFDKEDMVTLPTDIAGILIKKGRAEEISMGD